MKELTSQLKIFQKEKQEKEKEQQEKGDAVGAPQEKLTSVFSQHLTGGKGGNYQRPQQLAHQQGMQWMPQSMRGLVGMSGTGAFLSGGLAPSLVPRKW